MARCRSASIRWGGYVNIVGMVADVVPESKPTAVNIMRRFGSFAVALIAVQIDFFAIALALPNMAET